MCVFPYVDIVLHILTIMVRKYTAEGSFSQFKHIKNPKMATMCQDRLDALSLLDIEAYLLCQIGFEDLVKDFAIKKCREL